MIMDHLSVVVALSGVLVMVGVKGANGVDLRALKNRVWASSIWEISTP